MFKLMFEDSANENAMTPVRWCLDKADMDLARESGKKNLFVLIVVTYKTGENSDLPKNVIEDRYVVPFDELMMYITFRFPGHHHVLGMCIASDQDKQIEKDFLQKHGRYQYNETIISYDDKIPVFCYTIPNLLAVPEGTEKTVQDHIKQLNAEREESRKWRLKQTFGLYHWVAEEAAVEVPEEYFAKHWPGWLENGCNVWYDGPPRDKCELRKRAMFAFSIQPIILAIFVVLRSIMGVIYIFGLAYLGLRGIRLSPLWHPADEPLSDIYNPKKFRYQDWRRWPGRHNCWWWRKADGKLRTKKARLLLIFHPVAITLYLAILKGVALKFDMGYYQILRIVWNSGLSACLWLTTKPIYVLVISAAYFIIGYILRRFYLSPERREARDEARKARQDQEQITMEQNLWQERMGSASCNLAKLNLNALPARQSIKLRFLELKSKVCRPFAG